MKGIMKLLTLLTTFVAIKNTTAAFYGVEGHPGFPDSDYSSLLKHSLPYYPKIPDHQHHHQHHYSEITDHPDYHPDHQHHHQHLHAEHPVDVANFLTPPVIYHPSSDKITVHRHVFVHVAPDDEPLTETRVIRPDIPKHKHVNIIFVKAPTQSKNQLTEVHLPEEPKQKTLIYILVKKPQEIAEHIKVKGPEPTQPSKPEVFFIRYKDRSYTGQPSYEEGYPLPIEHSKDHHISGY